MSTRKRPTKRPTTTSKTTTGPRPAVTPITRPPAVAKPAGSVSRPVAPKPGTNGSARLATSATHTNGAARATTATVTATNAQPSWFSAAIRAFPYLGAAYVIFLAAIEAGTMAAVITGAVLAFTGLFLLYPRSDGVDDGASPQFPALLKFRENVSSWIGEVRSVAFGLFALWAGLFLWVFWHANGQSFFSWLSIIALIAALALIVRASYLRKEA